MNRIDETRPFIPVRIAVLTVSDTRTPETDKSGDTLGERIEILGKPAKPSSIATGPKS